MEDYQVNRIISDVERRYLEEKRYSPNSYKSLDEYLLQADMKVLEMFDEYDIYENKEFLDRHFFELYTNWELRDAYYEVLSCDGILIYKDLLNYISEIPECILSKVEYENFSVEMIKDLVERQPLVYKFLPEEFRLNKEIAISAVVANTELFKMAREHDKVGMFSTDDLNFPLSMFKDADFTRQVIEETDFFLQDSGDSVWRSNIMLVWFGLQNEQLDTLMDRFLDEESIDEIYEFPYIFYINKDSAEIIRIMEAISGRTHFAAEKKIFNLFNDVETISKLLKKNCIRQSVFTEWVYVEFPDLLKEFMPMQYDKYKEFEESFQKGLSRDVSYKYIIVNNLSDDEVLKRLKKEEIAITDISYKRFKNSGFLRKCCLVSDSELLLNNLNIMHPEIFDDQNEILRFADLSGNLIFDRTFTFEREFMEKLVLVNPRYIMIDQSGIRNSKDFLLANLEVIGLYFHHFSNELLQDPEVIELILKSKFADELVDLDNGWHKNLKFAGHYFEHLKKMKTNYREMYFKPLLDLLTSSPQSVLDLCRMDERLIFGLNREQQKKFINEIRTIISEKPEAILYLKFFDEQAIKNFNNRVYYKINEVSISTFVYLAVSDIKNIDKFKQEHFEYLLYGCPEALESVLKENPKICKKIINAIKKFEINLDIQLYPKLNQSLVMLGVK